MSWKAYINTYWSRSLSCTYQVTENAKDSPILGSFNKQSPPNFMKFKRVRKNLYWTVPHLENVKHWNVGKWLGSGRTIAEKSTKRFDFRNFHNFIKNTKLGFVSRNDTATTQPLPNISMFHIFQMRHCSIEIFSHALEFQEIWWALFNETSQNLEIFRILCDLGSVRY